jgi:hypothetical protein
MRQHERFCERSSRFDEPVRQTHAKRFFSRHGSSRQDHVEGVAMTDQSRESDRPAIDKGYAPTSAIDAKDRVACGYPQITPNGEFDATRDSVPFNRSNHWLPEQHPGRPHGTVAVEFHIVSSFFRRRFEVRTGTKRTLRTCQNRDREFVLLVKVAKRVREFESRGTIDAV